MKFVRYVLVALVVLSARGSVNASDQVMIEAAKKEGSLMIYNSMTPSQMQLIINAFRTKYPFIEVKVYRAVGERLLTKIFTEAQAGRHDFDILQSGDTQAYFLKKKNLLIKYVSSEVKYLPRIYVDPEGYWAAMYSMPKIIGYNTRMLKKAEVPRTDEELLNPKWKGKIATDNTKPEPFFWIMERMGHEKGIAYLKKLAAQEMRFYAGLSLLTSLLAAGEFPLGLYTYLHSVEEAKSKGAPVEWVAQDRVFTKFQPVSVAAKAPHPNAAKLYVDFGLSLEGQKLIASMGRIPVRTGVTTNIAGLDKLNFVVDDLSWVEDYNKNYEWFRSIFGVDAK
ncbi:MAG TPA: extracellular solute-binding protein [Candidatus Acidoferrales bacterium]|nr:extracellular solute-binding protein [Candidatus Acidoferrales bacterium]